MKALIIEDEYPAAERLQTLLKQAYPDIQILAHLPSVKESVQWLNAYPNPELIFSDIQLSDGLSFEIYEQLNIKSPIIFTTAFDEYAIKAFKVKSIDYLLKPIKPKELKDAISKFLEMKNDYHEERTNQQVEALMAMINQQSEVKNYKDRFLVKSRDQFIPLSISNISYFYTIHEVVYLYDKEGNKYVIDYTLEQLQELLDPINFFRINRQYISHLQGIAKIHPYFNGRLKLILHPEVEEEVFVSRDKAKKFKEWLGA